MRDDMIPAEIANDFAAFTSSNTLRQLDPASKIPDHSPVNLSYGYSVPTPRLR